MKLYCLSPPNMPADELGCLEYATDESHVNTLFLVKTVALPDWEDMHQYVWAAPTAGFYAMPAGHRVTIFGPALEALIDKCGSYEHHNHWADPTCHSPGCQRPPTASELVHYLEAQLKENDPDD